MSELQKWYDSINEEEIQPNGEIMKLTVPVLDNQGDRVRIEPANEPEIENVRDKIDRQMDMSMTAKETEKYMRGLLKVKKLKFLLFELISLKSPFEDDTEIRHNLLSELKNVYSDLGSELAEY